MTAKKAQKPEPVAKPKERTVKCGNCGAENPFGALTCENCGYTRVYLDPSRR